MQNLDNFTKKKDEIRNELAEAIRANDEARIGTAMDNWMQFVSETVMAEADGVVAATDRSILAARGIRQLTAEETKFYDTFITAARQTGPQTVITNITSALPQTVIDSVMDDMKAAYPHGMLCFICRLDSDEEVNDERMWHKANPSLRYNLTLLEQMRSEYASYRRNPAQNTAFITKRMNRPPKIRENGVASWEDICETNKPIPEADLIERPCVAGFDFAKTTDFIGAGLLWRVGKIDVWISHTWICTNCADLHRIKAPLREWEARGLVTFVDAPEIPAELPVTWVVNEAAKLRAQILCVGLDDYRFALMRRALEDFNFYADKEHKNVFLIRPRDEMRRVPVITSGFAGHRFIWGDSPPMRWAANNSKTITSAAGNITYGKIEPKSRKTDTFKAFVAAECVSDVLDAYANTEPTAELPSGCWTY